MVSDETFRAVMDELATLRAERRWQPFATAPKDGTEVLVFMPTEGVERALWSTWEAFHGPSPDGVELPPTWFAAWGPELNETPTHWTPLPAAPDATLSPAEHTAGEDGHAVGSARPKAVETLTTRYIEHVATLRSLVARLPLSDMNASDDLQRWYDEMKEVMRVTNPAPTMEES